MTTDAATIAAVLRRLAEAEEACKHPDWMDAFENCPDCNGTGRVPVFRDAKGKALFRKECPVMLHSSGDGSVLIEHGCGGLGWLPLDVSEVRGEFLIHLITGEEPARIIERLLNELAQKVWDGSN